MRSHSHEQQAQFRPTSTAESFLENLVIGYQNNFIKHVYLFESSSAVSCI